MNLILEKTDQVPFFTNMCLTFEALGIDCAVYDWYVSDVEINSGLQDFCANGAWFSGKELKSLIANDDLQFDWGVFSAVKSGERFEVDAVPYADGNPTFWQDPDLSPQLQGALFEIVCWDSSATLLIGISDEHAERFRNRFSDAKLLSDAAA